MTPPKTKKLFISYRSSDAAKVDKIAQDLSLLKYDDGTPRYTVWQDKHNLPPASPNWWDAIVDAIIKCDMFVFCISTGSLQSVVCRAELDYAHKRNRPIIPVVLEDEFGLNPKSGKYDLSEEMWSLVPDWFGEIQFLFYTGAKFYADFQAAVEGYERNWPRDVFAPRPLDPAEQGSNHSRYATACEYAEQLAFADADKQFSELVRRNDPDYADAAVQWLEVIRRYAEIIEIVEQGRSAGVFNTRWNAYQALFPNDFMDGIFDPKGFDSRDRIAQEAAEQERLAAEEAERQRLAREKADRDLAAAVEAERQRLAQQKPEPVAAPPPAPPAERYAQARQWYADERYEDALAEFKALLALGFKPRVGRLETYITDIETHLRERAEAQRLAEQTARYTQAQQWYADERYDDALAEFKALRTLGFQPQEGRLETLIGEIEAIFKERAQTARYTQAQQWYADGRYAEALAEFKALLALGFQPKAGSLEALIDDSKARQHAAACAEAYAELAVELKSARTPQVQAEVQAAIRDFMRDCPDHEDTLGILPPAPFAWIEIPGGRGTMNTNESGVTLTIPTERYWIAKYPVTNAQFAKFVEAGGYNQQKWWTAAGWAQRHKEQWTQPRYWTNSQWNGAHYPVVGVSWYEAVAFCLWLSDLTGENIMLPTEAQWQYAAQGDDGRVYPWGNEWYWDGLRCNNNVNGRGIGRTTPVRTYEGKGDSRFGVVDMAGNVSEWCLTSYNNRTNEINSNSIGNVVRGGSWLNDNTGSFRCDSRGWDFSRNGVSVSGFRCARSG